MEPGKRFRVYGRSCPNPYQGQNGMDSCTGTACNNGMDLPGILPSRQRSEGLYTKQIQKKQRKDPPCRGKRGIYAHIKRPEKINLFPSWLNTNIVYQSGFSNPGCNSYYSLSIDPGNVLKTCRVLHTYIFTIDFSVRVQYIPDSSFQDSA